MPFCINLAIDSRPLFGLFEGNTKLVTSILWLTCLA